MRNAWIRIIPCLLLTGWLTACAEEPAGPATVGIEQAADGRWLLTRDGEPYDINGAGIEFGDVERFAARGGNSFRTWRTDNGEATGQEVLDRALAAGVTVAMCIEIGRERHGFDYDDADAVARQLEYARQEVLKYRDHPALLVWIIGNEPNLEFKNPKVFDAINDISKMIHELDPNHPTTTALAGFGPELAAVLEERSPDLDFLSVQMYGDIVNLPRYLDAAGHDAPIFVTEWGAIGHWEVHRTPWGAPVEQNSSEKAGNYLKSYEQAIRPRQQQIIGSYVFLWGQKQERTPTWYGMFTETGEATETVDVMQYIWTGEWPANRSPQLGSMRLDGRNAYAGVRLAPGAEVMAEVAVTDPDGDSLRYHWELREESRATETGGDKEYVPALIDGLQSPVDAASVTLRTPATPGAYRLFMYAYDGAGNAAHANIPFLVAP